jgi:ketosteroid isomerase-like protein
MSAEEQKQSAQDGYAAFGKGDAEAAMANISDSIQWVVGGDSSVSGTYTGKGEVMGFWGKLLEKGFTTSPSEFLADGGRVVVLSTVSVGGESRDVADVLTYDDDGKLTRFQSFGGEDLLNQTYPK